MSVPVTPPHRNWFSLPEEPARRLATWSLLMVAATVVMLVIVGVVGTYLLTEVFDLNEGELLTEAGTWGYVTAFLLLALLALPCLAGILLGVRARRLGEQSRGTTGILVNALILAFFVVPAAANLLLF